jgi:hypothetical protein
MAWKELLELCTVENSIAVTGLKHLLASLDDCTRYWRRCSVTKTWTEAGYCPWIGTSKKLLMNGFEMKDVSAGTIDRGYLQRRADRLSKT